MTSGAHQTDKSFLVLFFKKEQNFFFEKKKQKTFASHEAHDHRWGRDSVARRRGCRRLPCPGRTQ